MAKEKVETPQIDMVPDNPPKRNRFVEWWKKITREQWMLTVFYPGQTQVLADGTRIEQGAPETYHITKIIKLDHKHMIFIDTDKIRHEIKLISPVGYEIKKIY